MEIELPRVRVENQNDSWIGTKCYIDGKKVDNVRRIDFSVAVEEIPTFTFETIGIPDIDMPGRIILDCKPENVTEAVQILRNELLKHNDVYNGFISSISSALKYHWKFGLPLEADESAAKKILDRVIGED